MALSWPTDLFAHLTGALPLDPMGASLSFMPTGIFQIFVYFFQSHSCLGNLVHISTVSNLVCSVTHGGCLTLKCLRCHLTNSDLFRQVFQENWQITKSCFMTMQGV